jgi:hypothetical protein
MYATDSETGLNFVNLRFFLVCFTAEKRTHRSLINDGNWFRLMSVDWFAENTVRSESHCARIKGDGNDVHESLYRPKPV